MAKIGKVDIRGILKVENRKRFASTEAQLSTRTNTNEVQTGRPIRQLAATVKLPNAVPVGGSDPKHGIGKPQCGFEADNGFDRWFKLSRPMGARQKRCPWGIQEPM